MNTVSVPSCWGCNLENNFLFQFRPITQGDKDMEKRKHSWVFTRYTPEPSSVTCTAPHRGREPPASAVMHYRVMGLSCSIPSLYQTTAQPGVRSVPIRWPRKLPWLGRWEGNKVLVPEPGLHIFLNQARLARASSATFYGCHPGPFTSLCWAFSYNYGWRVFVFSFEFCVCVLNLHCSKKIHFSWTTTKHVFWIRWIFTKD